MSETLESALSNLDSAADFWLKVKAASKDGDDTTSTGAFRDAWEWLRDAALAVADARTKAHVFAPVAPRVGSQEEATPNASTLEDAAIVCERPASRHKGVAAGVRSIAAAIANMAYETNVGESPSGFALVPLQAYNAVALAAPAPAASIEPMKAGAEARSEPRILLKSIAVDGEPSWDETARAIVYTDGSDFAGEQVFDIPVRYFHEPYDAEDPQGPRHEVVEAATHWVLRDDFVLSLPRARAFDAAGDSTERDAGAESARTGVHDVSAGFDDVPFVGCPEDWTEKPFCRIEWISDGGDPGVGHPARSGWSLARDQSGTLVADLARLLSGDASGAAGGTAAAVAAWKWGYEYLQQRMASLGREGWAHDCDEEIVYRIAQGLVAAPAAAAARG